MLERCIDLFTSGSLGLRPEVRRQTGAAEDERKIEVPHATAEAAAATDKQIVVFQSSFLRSNQRLYNNGAPSRPCDSFSGRCRIRRCADDAGSPSSLLDLAI